MPADITDNTTGATHDPSVIIPGDEKHQLDPEAHAVAPPAVVAGKPVESNPGYFYVTNFVQRPLPPGSTTGAGGANGQAGALNMGQRASTGIGTFNQFWMYTTPLFGAYIADAHWGRYKTICVALVIAIVAHILFVISALPPVIANPQGALGCFMLGVLILGVGTGGFKPNVAALVVEQLPLTKMVVRTHPNGERVIHDPSLTASRVYMYFYLFINIGALVGQLCMTYTEKYVGFWLAWLLPTLIYCICPAIMLRARKRYRRTPPQGSVLAKALRIWIYAQKGRWSLNPIQTWRNLHDGLMWESVKPSNIQPHLRPEWMTFDDEWVEEATVLQYYIYKTNPCGKHANTCVDADGNPRVSPINIGAQTGAFVLIAISEIFANVTSLEYAYSKAPRNMRSLVQAVALFTNAISSAIGEALIPLSDDPLLIWNYAIPAILAVCGGTIFWIQFRGLDGEEDRLNNLPRGTIVVEGKQREPDSDHDEVRVESNTIEIDDKKASPPDESWGACRSRQPGLAARATGFLRVSGLAPRRLEGRALAGPGSVASGDVLADQYG
ncbi:hypothetical protein V494_01338 [Pseudogymnoascus sp. VKM F-4513 (FW-928)]|nr:hypothetical protein V494_01338 [Pseudogymnoascus sp. VKM F-4513 (FW-928)]